MRDSVGVWGRLSADCAITADRRRLRRTAAAAVFAFLLLALFWSMPAGLAHAEYVTEGYGDSSFSAAGVSAPTGEKPQSKLWYAQDSWWGCLFVPTSLAPGGQSGFKIHRLDWATQEWVNTEVLIDARPNARMDALWDGNALYVASAGVDPANSADSVRLYKFTYDVGTSAYVAAEGFPVTLVDGGVEAVVMDKDTTGALWITYTRDLTVYVSHSTTSDATWITPYDIPVPEAGGLSPDDISAVVAYQGNIGVMWSSNAYEPDDAVYFATHVDGAGDDAWTVEAALQLPEYADDHINLKSLQTNNRGQVYAATKTSRNGTADDLILLLELDKHGTWKRYTFSTVADEQTRPIVLLDPTSDRVHMFAAAPGGPGGVVYYKSSPLNRISFEPGPGTPFIMSETDLNINNPSSTKQTVSPTTGLVVIASDDHTKRYLHNSIDLGVVDTINPDTKILSAPLDTEAIFSPVFEFESNEEGVTFEVSVDGGDYVASGATFTAARLTVGPHTLSVRAVDGTGNVDPIPATWSWEVNPFVVNFDVIADAYFDGATPGVNYGTDWSLMVDGSSTGGNESRAVLRFDLPTGVAAPASAAVHLYAYNGVSTNGPYIYRTSDPWDETTVTWNNQPATPDPPLSQDVNIPPDTWGSFDVTAAVVGEGTYDFLLDESSSDGVFFYAREVPLYRPHATLTYASAPNFPPEIDPIADIQVDEGTVVGFTAVGWDPMGDELTFSLTSAPATASIDPTTGIFEWVTGEADGPGTYPVTVRVTDPGGAFAETSFTVTVLEAPSISGRVTDVDTTAGVAGVEVLLTGPSDATVIASVTTDADGYFMFAPVSPGQYRVRTQNSLGYLDEWYDDVLVVVDSTGTTASVLDITTDQAGVDFALILVTSPTLPVSGVVVDSLAAGIEGAQVQAFDDVGAVVDSTTTDGAGAYTLTGLAPGRYRIQAQAFGYYAEWWDDVRVADDPDGATATPIVLTGTTTGIDFVLAESTTTVVRSVVAGWNLLAGASGSDILGETAFAYVGGVYQSTSGANMVAALGYWVHFDTAGEVTLETVPAPLDVHLSVGWNLIGNSTPDTVALPVGLTAFVFVNGVYITSDLLEPGQGAWVRSASEQDIVLEVVG
jgi:hypothetical protein